MSTPAAATDPRTAAADLPPISRATPGQWNAYVAAAPTATTRAARLAEVPAPWRAGVESHLRTRDRLREARR